MLKKIWRVLTKGIEIQVIKRVGKRTLFLLVAGLAIYGVSAQEATAGPFIPNVYTSEVLPAGDSFSWLFHNGTGKDINNFTFQTPYDYSVFQIRPNTFENQLHPMFWQGHVTDLGPDSTEIEHEAFTALNLVDGGAGRFGIRIDPTAFEARYGMGLDEIPLAYYSDFTAYADGPLIPGLVSFTLSIPDPSKIPTPTPEPASMILLGMGLMGVAVVSRKRFNRA